MHRWPTTRIFTPAWRQFIDGSWRSLGGGYRGSSCLRSTGAVRLKVLEIHEHDAPFDRFRYAERNSSTLAVNSLQKTPAGSRARQIWRNFSRFGYMRAVSGAPRG